MNADFFIPLKKGGDFKFSLSSGCICFLLGANGTGKSTLMYRLSLQFGTRARKITAHRQIWFNSNTLELTPLARQQTGNNIANHDQNEQSRFKDDYGYQRAQACIFDLIDAENQQNKRIADVARSKDSVLLSAALRVPSPLNTLNEVLLSANLDFEIDIGEGQKINARRAQTLYSAAELSDGERNALFIAANVLTAPPESIILLDEPERHLHRSIISPLLTTLLSRRADCIFVVSTHDVFLPLDQENAAAILVRSYSHPQRLWDVDYIRDVKAVDQSLARSVLGSKRKILYIEGTDSSLDIHIYRLLFPEYSVIPKGSCTDVQKAVIGLRSAGEFAWAEAFGLIDEDSLDQLKKDELRKEGLILLDCYSVESLYYDPNVVRAVVIGLSEIRTLNVDSVLQDYVKIVTESVSAHLDRMAARVAERKVQDLVARNCPTWRDIAAGNASTAIDASNIFSEQKTALQGFLDNSDVKSLVRRLPIRETEICARTATLLGLKSRGDYEDCVRTIISKRGSLWSDLRARIALP